MKMPHAHASSSPALQLSPVAADDPKIEQKDSNVYTARDERAHTDRAPKTNHPESPTRNTRAHAPRATSRVAVIAGENFRFYIHPSFQPNTAAQVLTPLLYGGCDKEDNFYHAAPTAHTAHILFILNQIKLPKTT